MFVVVIIYVNEFKLKEVYKGRILCKLRDMCLCKLNSI